MAIARIARWHDDRLPSQFQRGPSLGRRPSRRNCRIGGSECSRHEKRRYPNRSSRSARFGGPDGPTAGAGSKRPSCSSPIPSANTPYGPATCGTCHRSARIDRTGQPSRKTQRAVGLHRHGQKRFGDQSTTGLFGATSPRGGAGDRRARACSLELSVR